MIAEIEDCARDGESLEIKVWLVFAVFFKLSAH